MPKPNNGPKSKAKTPFGRGAGVPHPIDILIGKRIRARRLILGMTQDTLAKALKLTFQQVQKYEVGSNRVSASRLSEIADVFRVPILFFSRASNPSTHPERGDSSRPSNAWSARKR